MTKRDQLKLALGMFAAIVVMIGDGHATEN